MKVIQRHPKLFAPQVTLQRDLVVDAAASTLTVTHRQITVDEVTGSTGHNDYVVSGANLNGLTISQSSVADAVDASDYPRLKRSAGINQSVTVKFSNGRGETDPFQLVFSDLVSPTFRTAPKTVIPGGYAEYSLGRVQSLFSSLSSPAMYGAGPAFLRAAPSIIPHEKLTGHVFYGGWGEHYEYAGPTFGRRFSAITPRHVLGCSHYGGSNYQVGTVLKFRTANNETISRTVVEALTWNEIIPDDYVPPGPSGLTIKQADIAIFLLDSALPESIQPFPVAGEWINSFLSGTTDTNIVACPQFFGIILFGNDGHICPAQTVFTSDIEFSWPTVTWGEFPLTNKGTNLPCNSASSVSLNGYGDLAFDLPSGDFYHQVRGGDSGSPILAPVTNGWAICGIYAGGFWDPASLNHLISMVDSNAGISTGYTVTVAPNPVA